MDERRWSGAPGACADKRSQVRHGQPLVGFLEYRGCSGSGSSAVGNRADRRCSFTECGAAGQAFIVPTRYRTLCCCSAPAAPLPSVLHLILIAHPRAAPVRCSARTPGAQAADGLQASNMLFIHPYTATAASSPRPSYGSSHPTCPPPSRVSQSPSEECVSRLTARTRTAACLGSARGSTPRLF
jgi:hypothetical protein